MEVHHDLDVRPDRFPQRAHHARRAIHLRQRSAVMRVGNDRRFHRAIAARDNFVRALHEPLRRLGFIDRAHVAKAKCV